MQANEALKIIKNELLRVAKKRLSPNLTRQMRILTALYTPKRTRFIATH